MVGAGHGVTVSDLLARWRRCWPSAVIVTRLAGLGRPRDVLLAAVRAVVQLAVVSLVIGFVLRSLWLTFAFLAVMVTVAAATSARRITAGLRPGSW